MEAVPSGTKPDPYLMNLPPLVKGLLFGLLFVFSIGPAFFSLIQTSVQKGLRKAIFLALGISVSDVFFVILALMGLSSILEKSTVRMWVAIFGTAVLIAYGIYSWFKKPRVYSNKIETTSDLTYLKYFLKGMVLNGANPFIIVFWMSLMSVVAVKNEYGFDDQGYFFTGVLITIFTTDILKAVISHRLRAVITMRSILIMNRTVSVMLILFGIRLLYFLFENYW